MWLCQGVCVCNAAPQYYLRRVADGQCDSSSSASCLQQDSRTPDSCVSAAEGSANISMEYTDTVKSLP